MALPANNEVNEIQPFSSLNALCLGPERDRREVSVKCGCYAKGPQMEYVRALIVLKSSETGKISLSDVRLVANEG